MRLLFVCLGNICRSPTAEGVMRALVADAGLEHRIEVDSAGTGAWHVGSAPDERARAAALAHGVTLEGRARQATAQDLERFDLVLAMDSANARELRRLAGPETRHKVRLLREFPLQGRAVIKGGRDPEGADTADLDVPDPYYGAGDGFERVYTLVHAACEGLLADIRHGTLT